MEKICKSTKISKTRRWFPVTSDRQGNTHFGLFCLPNVRLAKALENIGPKYTHFWRGQGSRDGSMNYERTPALLGSLWNFVNFVANFFFFELCTKENRIDFASNFFLGIFIQKKIFKARTPWNCDFFENRWYKCFFFKITILIGL